MMKSRLFLGLFGLASLLAVPTAASATFQGGSDASGTLFEKYRSACFDGNGQSCAQAGDLLWRSTPDRVYSALQFYTYACNDHMPEICFKLADIYWKGIRVDQSSDLALHALQVARYNAEMDQNASALARAQAMTDAINGQTTAMQSDSDGLRDVNCISFDTKDYIDYVEKHDPDCVNCRDRPVYGSSGKFTNTCSFSIKVGLNSNAEGTKWISLRPRGSFSGSYGGLGNVIYAKRER